MDQRAACLVMKERQSDEEVKKAQQSEKVNCKLVGEVKGEEEKETSINILIDVDVFLSLCPTVCCCCLNA